MDKRLGSLVTKTIRKIVSEELYPARVVSLDVHEDEDYTGEPVLRVQVVVELDGGRLNPRKVAGLHRHLRDPLGELHEERFPIFTFMTPDECNGAAA